MIRHLLDLDGLEAATLRGILDDARVRKAARAGFRAAAVDADAPAAGASAALVFAKPSTRTRVACELAMRQLGGAALTLDANTLNMSRGESVEDTARVLGRMNDLVALRGSRDMLARFAASAGVPVTNLLTERSHPCQIVADMMTIEARLGAIETRKIAWCGPGSNVAASWLHAAGVLGFAFAMACPPGHDPDADILAWAQARNAKVRLTRDPEDALDGAECVITDTWRSMGEEAADAAALIQALTPYQITQARMHQAVPEAMFLHCMPAYRGQEVTAEVMDSPASAALDAAENRLHAHKSLFAWQLGAQ